ncbi:MAG: prepilin-type N-terminal cleavage/methylation domain-containing protein, partial [Myxococcota bacterium]
GARRWGRGATEVAGCDDPDDWNLEYDPEGDVMARSDSTVRQKNGFTLIEVLVTVAIFSVLAALAVGSLTSLTWNQRLNEVALELYAAVTKARSEGMRLSRPTVVQVLLSGDVGDDADIAIIAFFDESDPKDYVYTAGVDTLIHEHRINEQLLSGLTGTPATTYGEQLVFDDAATTGNFVTSLWDGTAIPRTILFNNQGFSYDWGTSETEQILHAVSVDVSDPVNIESTLIKRLELTVAGAARLRTCSSTTNCD